MDSLTFFVQGSPKAQPRVKAGRRGAFIRIYTPKTADDWKGLVTLYAKQEICSSAEFPVFPKGVPIRVDLEFVFERPKAHFRANGQLKPNAPIWHTSKPDRDNLDKSVLDALTNLQLFHDDAQVAVGLIAKQYAALGEATGCRITINRL